MGLQDTGRKVVGSREFGVWNLNRSGRCYCRLKTSVGVLVGFWPGLNFGDCRIGGLDVLEG